MDDVTIRRSTYHVAASRPRDHDESHANMVVPVEVSGDLNRLALEEALWRIAARHETLRCGFARTGQQLVHAHCDIDLADAECPPGEIHEFVRSHVTRPFDLSSAPLWRVHLVQSGGQRYLVFVFNHFIFDGPSVSLFLHELAVLYGDASGRPLEQLPPALQFADFAERERAAEYRPQDREWWRRALNVPGLEWDEPPTGVPVVSYAESIQIDGGVGPLPVIGHARQPAFIRAAITEAIAGDLPSDHAVLAVVLSRRDEDSRRAIGWLTDHVPVPFRIRRDESVPERVTRLQEAMNEARRHWPGSAYPVLEDAAQAHGRPAETMLHAWSNYLPVNANMGWEIAGNVKFAPLAVRTDWVDEPLPGPTRGVALGYHVRVDRTTSRLVGIDARGPSDCFTRDQLRERAWLLVETVQRMLHDGGFAADA